VSLEDIFKVIDLNFQYSAKQHGRQAKLSGGKTLAFFFFKFRFQNDVHCNAVCFIHYTGEFTL